jgi:FCP1-like phosphatase family protein
MSCSHPVTYNTLCVACGKVVPNSKSSASLAVKGGVLQLSADEAVKIQSSKATALQKLQQNKKLALVLDLDHTLLHAVQVDGPTPKLTVQSNGDIHHLPIEEIVGGSVKHLVMKKRPHLDYFLDCCHNLFQMSIYTAGTRRYAEAVVKVIDPTRKYVGDRIVSRIDGQPVRPDAIDKSLDKIFLNDSSMAVIMDDREDVWKGPQSDQLLLVRPYVYFYPGSQATQLVGGAKNGIAEVNNKPGLSGTATPASQNEVGSPAPAISLHETPGKILKIASQTTAEYTECDDQLLRCLDVLKAIHSKYYIEEVNEAERGIETTTSTTAKSSSSSGSVVGKKSVATTLKVMKSSILSGYTITFSGIIPTNESRPENHFLWKLAESLGAQVSAELTQRTTHLLSFQPNTKKVTTCLQARSGDVWVLHPDWLIYCRWSLAKAEESTFLLIGIPVNQKMPNPAKDFSPLEKYEEPNPAIGKVKKRKVEDVLNSIDSPSNTGIALSFFESISFTLLSLQKLEKNKNELVKITVQVQQELS